MLLLFSLAHAESEVTLLQHTFKDRQLVVIPQLLINPKPAVTDAILNGIPITLIIKVKAFQQVSWWPDTVVDEMEHSLTIQYFSLSGQYVLRNLYTQQQSSFITLRELLNHIGNNTQFVLGNVEDPVDYIGVRIVLDSGALPSSMQLPILFNSEWDLDSEWSYQEVR
ncbi:DUF4390 domain-containing protein [Marinicella sp. W31]|uniref:DUF4390 domain-containing protein n=1 Tax=Marinicella sp. W31 TaxID=3023713 RepID=UPI003757EB9F